MVKVLGPNNIPITSPTGAAPTRSSAAAFGAPQAAAVQDVGKSLSALGQTFQRVKDENQQYENQSFLDRYDLETDMTYGRIGNEEEGKAISGAEGMTDTVRQRMETETPSIVEKLKQQGYRPSDEALKKAESISLRRQHQHLTRAFTYENNERVRHLGTRLDDSLQTIAGQGVQSGDIDGALSRAEQSIEAHKGIIPPAGLDTMRDKAAKYFFEQVKANGKPEDLEMITQRLLQGDERPSTPAEGAADAAGRAMPSSPPEAPARGSSFQIPDAERRNLPAGMRNNNPGNIKYTSKRAFAGVTGPSENTDQGDPQAVFSTPQEGMNAAADLALRKYRGGKTSAMELIAGRMGWTPGNTQAAANIARTMGIGPNDDLGLDKPEGMARFLKALTVQEHGAASKLYPDELYRNAAGGGGGPMAEPTIRGALAREMSSRLPEIQTLIEKRREQEELRRRSISIISGNEPMDPGSAEDKKTMNRVMAATDIPERLGQADPAAAGQLTALVKNTGYVPDLAISQLRATSANGTPEQKVFALETAANILREKPGAFEASDAARDLRDNAQLYETLVQDAGLGAQEALSRIAERRTPEFAKRKEALKKEIAEAGSASVLRDLSPADITADYDGMFTATPALGGSPRQEGLVFDTYRELVKHHYLNTGDIDAAKGMAKRDLKRTYDVTEVTGNKRLMRHPPDAYYPKLEPRAGKEPSLDYFGEQLAATVNDYLRGPARAASDANPETRSGSGAAALGAVKEIPLSDIFIEPVPQTNADVRTGRLPGYAVMWFEEKDGIKVMNTAPGMVFRADVKGEQQKQKGNREERARYLRRQELEDQAAIDRDPARRAGKAVGEFLRDNGPVLPTDTGAADRLRGGNREFFQGQPNLINEPE